MVWECLYTLRLYGVGVHVYVIMHGAGIYVYIIACGVEINVYVMTYSVIMYDIEIYECICYDIWCEN